MVGEEKFKAVLEQAAERAKVREPIKARRLFPLETPSLEVR